MLSFRNHPKTKKLKYKLGSDGVLSLIWLMMFAAESKSDGVLDGMDEVDIALAADWSGDPKEFVQTLFAARFLDKENGSYVIHDWSENNPWAANSESRKEHARKAAEARWSKRYGTKNQQLSTKNDAPSIDGHAQCNAPTPTPTPTPTPIPNQDQNIKHPPASPAPDDPWKEFFDEAKTVLGEEGRSLAGKLKAVVGEPVEAFIVLDQCRDKEQPRAYFAATIRNLAREKRARDAEDLKHREMVERQEKRLQERIAAGLVDEHGRTIR
jgi:hypothetical protein